MLQQDTHTPAFEPTPKPYVDPWAHLPFVIREGAPVHNSIQVFSMAKLCRLGDRLAMAGETRAYVELRLCVANVMHAPAGPVLKHGVPIVVECVCQMCMERRANT